MLGSGRQQAAAPDQSPLPGMEATDFQGRGACPTCSEGAVLRSIFRLQRGLPLPRTLVLPARARLPGGTAHSDSVGSAQGPSPTVWGGLASVLRSTRQKLL